VVPWGLPYLPAFRRAESLLVETDTALKGGKVVLPRSIYFDAVPDECPLWRTED